MKNTPKKLTHLDSALAYSKLKKTITEEGVLERDYMFYTLLVPFVFAGFLAAAATMYFAQNPFIIMAAGVIFAFFAIQMGGLFHDAGHRAIFNSTKNNDIIGQICCSLVVYPYKNWKNLHNKHHANPNQEDNDPDIELPFLAFTKETVEKKTGIPKLLAKYQAYIYFPLSVPTAIFWQLRDFTYLRKYAQKLANWEIALYLAGIFVWLILPFFLFGPIKAILIYLSVYPLMGIYMFNVFAPNHKGMPQLKKDVRLSFLEHQILTTRNLNGGLIPDFIYMGLNYQMEHHLFPNCPRNKLKLITPHLKKVCQELNLQYTSVNTIQSNVIIFNSLKQISSFV